MRPFKYTLPADPKTALQRLSANPQASYLGGGTNILDLMKEDVARPDELVDISRLSLTALAKINTGVNKGGLSLGSTARNSDTANHPLVRQKYPLLSQAILAGASAQIRNMATNGGNLLQRTRCSYFYDVSMPCNKREPGTGCSAKEGINRMHAIFGWSDACVAVYPSDMAIALSALDATVRVRKPTGTERSIAFSDFHRLPGDTPERDNSLEPGELIIAIDLPPNRFANNSCYLKVRDRASYAFALVSVAVGLEMRGTAIGKVNISLGGVAHKPWRASAAEAMLAGREASDTAFEAAAAEAVKEAKPLEHNRFKINLCHKAIVRALQLAAKGNNA